MNILIHVFSEICTFMLNIYFRVELINHRICACFTLVEKCHTIFKSGCNGFHSHQQSWRVSLAPYTCWILSIFLHLLRWPFDHQIFSVNLLMWWITLTIFFSNEKGTFHYWDKSNLVKMYKLFVHCLIPCGIILCRVFTSVFIGEVGLYFLFDNDPSSLKGYEC